MKRFSQINTKRFFRAFGLLIFVMLLCFAATFGLLTFVLPLSFAGTASAIGQAPDEAQSQNTDEAPNALAQERASLAAASKPQEQADPRIGRKKESPGLTHDALIDALLQRMASPDERTRLEAGIALKETARLSDVPLLVRILKRGNNRDKQLFLIETLASLQDRTAGEALRFEVRHGDLESQRASVTALGKLKYNWPIPVLVRVLRQSEDEELRKRAASALGEIGTPQAVYSLRTSLSSLEEAVGAKNAAFWALEKARGEIDDQLIDTKMPQGRRLQLYYKGMRYYFYHPAYRRGSSINKVGLRPWLLVCVHDKDLRAEELFNICWRAGKKRQMAVLVPLFDNLHYPEFGNFNIRGDRADKRLLELIEHVGRNASLTVREFFLFGYGVGGDFVQKFVMSYPLRIARAAFESDEYTLPDTELYFPKGLNRTPLAPDVGIDMYKFLKTESVLILRKNSESIRDGKGYYESVQHYADINGFRSRMSLRTVDVKFEIWNEAEKYLFSFE